MAVDDGLGTHEWTMRTSGVMSPAECRHLIPAVVRGQFEFLAGFMWLLANRRPRRSTAALPFTTLTPPDGRLATAAEEACAEQGSHVMSHSFRTWAYGRALALLDNTPLDDKLFYVACLLHDYGLEHPRAGEDFTLRSATRAMRCVRAFGGSEDEARVVADAITLHVTPGIPRCGDTALGHYVQAGSLLDLAGTRAWELPRAYHDTTGAACSRAGVKDSFIGLVRAEALANPRSRFGLLYRCGITLGFRLNPMNRRQP